MPNLLLTIRYDGSRYHGWQVQKIALSIQTVLQEAIWKLFGERMDIKGCSRTDAGVHANMYCVSFHAPFYPGEYHTICAVNNALPDDIKAYKCEEVSDDFHARYSCVAKEYVYQIYNAKHENPFMNRYAFQYKYHIDEALLNRAAAQFTGTHDFSAFCSSHCDAKDTVRTIYSCCVEREGDMIRIRICGNGFLYNMVRIIAGTLLDVARGRLRAEDISQIILSGSRKDAGKTLAAKGLFLNKVFYGEVKLES